MNPVSSILNEFTITKAEETDYLGEDGLYYSKCDRRRSTILRKHQGLRPPGISNRSHKRKPAALCYHLLRQLPKLRKPRKNQQ